jgi:hypothetical protein
MKVDTSADESLHDLDHESVVSLHSPILAVMSSLGDSQPNAGRKAGSGKSGEWIAEDVTE